MKSTKTESSRSSRKRRKGNIASRKEKEVCTTSTCVYYIQTSVHVYVQDHVIHSCQEEVLQVQVHVLSSIQKARPGRSGKTYHDRQLDRASQRPTRQLSHVCLFLSLNIVLGRFNIFCTKDSFFSPVMLCCTC